MPDILIKPNLRGCLVHKNKTTTIPALFHMWYFAQNGCPLALVELQSGSLTSVAYQNVIFLHDDEEEETFEFLNHVISKINEHEEHENE